MLCRSLKITVIVIFALFVQIWDVNAQLSQVVKVKRLASGELEFASASRKNGPDELRSQSTQQIAGLTVEKLDSLGSDPRFQYRNILAWEEGFKVVSEFGSGNCRILIKSGDSWREIFSDYSGYRTLLWSGVKAGKIYLELLSCCEVAGNLYNHVQIYASYDANTFVMEQEFFVPNEYERWLGFCPLLDEESNQFNLIYSSEGLDSCYSVYYQGRDSFYLSGANFIDIKSVFLDGPEAYGIIHTNAGWGEILISKKGWGDVIRYYGHHDSYWYFANGDQSSLAPLPLLRVSDGGQSNIINAEGQSIHSFADGDFVISRVYKEGLGVVITDHFWANSASMVIFDKQGVREYPVETTFLARVGNISAIINNNREIIVLLQDGSVCLVKETVTGLKDIDSKINFNLSQNYPNPFNPTTKIKFSLAEAGLVSLKVYDLLGCQVAVLVSEELPAGAHEVSFDASSLASGLYTYTLCVGQHAVTRKMALLK